MKWKLCKDRFPESGTFPKDGQRVLLCRVEADEVCFDVAYFNQEQQEFYVNKNSPPAYGGEYYAYLELPNDSYDIDDAAMFILSFFS